MDKTKHTPGPWTLDTNPRNVHAQNYTQGHLYDIAIALGPLTADRDEAEANARLIAAAPELLEVCQSLVKLNAATSGFVEYVSLCRLLKTAVAKATISEPVQETP